MDNKDISIMIGDTGFNYRVAALIECENKILLHKPDNWDFWNLPGGRVKTNEQSDIALIRELEEELGYIFNDLKFIQLAENFFLWQGKNAHELLFIFKIVLSKEHPITSKQDFTALDNDKLIFHWFEKTEIKNIRCLPTLIYSLADKKDDDFIHTCGS